MAKTMQVKAPEFQVGDVVWACNGTNKNLHECTKCGRYSGVEYTYFPVEVKITRVSHEVIITSTRRYKTFYDYKANDPKLLYSIHGDPFKTKEACQKWIDEELND